MAGNFQPPPRIKNALDNRKLYLSAPTPGVQGKNASLQWGIFVGNPRITVFTGDPNDQGEQNGYGKISANMDPQVFLAWLNNLRKVMETPGGPENKNCLDCTQHVWFGGKKSQTPEVVAKLWYGKDAEGVVWLCLVDAKKESRPKIKFEICHSEYHQFRHADGSAFTKGEMSEAMVNGYFTLLAGMIPQMVIQAWPEVEKKDEERKAQAAARQAGGGGGGRGNWGGGGGGGNRGGYGGGGGYGGQAQQTNDAVGSDIPF